MNFYNKKYLVVGSIGFLLIIILLIEWTRHKTPKIPPVYVEITHPKLFPMDEMISASGNIEAVKETRLASKLPGKIQKILVQEGALVEVDELLIELDAKELKLQKEIAESAHRSAASQVDEENYKRHKVLYEEGVISKAEFDKIESQYKAAKADEERLESTVQLQGEQVSSSQLKAPFRSIAAKIFVQEGEVVAAGQPLALLVNMDQVLVEVPIISKHISRLEVGQKSFVTVDHSNKKFFGQIDQISQVADPLSRTFDTKIIVQNEDNILKPGMFAKTSIVIHSNPNAVTLPKTALVKREDLKQPTIYIVENKKAKQMTVQIGIETADEIEITSPLSLDLAVVTAGHSQLYEGAPVEIVTPHHEVP